MANQFLGDSSDNSRNKMCLWTILSGTGRGFLAVKVILKKIKIHWLAFE